MEPKGEAQKNNRKSFSATEVGYLGYHLLLPKLKKLLHTPVTDERELLNKNKIEIVKLRLAKVLKDPKNFKIKNILMRSPLWDNDLNILAFQLQDNV